MIEIYIGIIGIIIAIILFFIGISYGKQQSSRVISELKNQNKNLSDKMEQSNQQNKKLIEKIEGLKKQYEEQKQILEKSYQAIGVFTQQNNELTQKVVNLESQVQYSKPITATSPKKKSEINNLVKDLVLYGAKEWSKKQINEWLYSDD